MDGDLTLSPPAQEKSLLDNNTTRTSNSSTDSGSVNQARHRLIPQIQLAKKWRDNCRAKFIIVSSIITFITLIGIGGISMKNWVTQQEKSAELIVNDDDVLADIRKHNRSSSDQINTEMNKRIKGIPESIALYPLCTTKACQIEGEAIAQDIVHATWQEPCQNFYDFVCSKWTKTNPLDDTPRNSVEDTILDSYEELLVKELQKKRPGYEKVQKVFQSCVNDQSDKQGSFDIVFLNLLKNLELTNENIDLNRAVLSLMRRGIEPLYKIKLQKDPEVSNLAYAILSEPELIVGYRNNHDKVFENFINNLNVWNKSITQKYLGTIKEISKIEMFLHSNFEKNIPRENHGHKDELKSIKDHYYIINQKLKKVLVELLGDDVTSQLNNILTLSLKYTSALANTKSLEEQKASLLKYFGFRAILDLSPLFPRNKETEQLFALKENRWKEFRPATNISRQRLCLRWMTHHDPAILQQVSLDAAYEKIGGKAQVIAMLNLIDTIFNETITQLTNEDFDLQLHLSDRLESMTWEYLAPQSLVRYNDVLKRQLQLYEDAVMKNSTREEILQNYIMKMVIDKHKDALRKTDESVNWPNDVSTLTEVHVPPPFKLLQIPMPVFDLRHTNDKSMERFTLLRVGFKIFRALFNLVYHLSYNYNFGKQKVNKPLTENFHHLTDCLQRQNSKIHRFDTKARLSVSSSHENMLNHLSLNAAYKAYKRYPKIVSQSGTRLPKVDHFTPNQLFYIQYARQFCESTSTAYHERQTEEGTIAPSWYRVNSPLRNFKPFSRTFNCKLGSFMNPTDKCSIKIDE